MTTIIVWFRNDYRLSDHPALYHASREADSIIPLIIDDEAEDPWPAGAASRLWRDHSRQALAESLAEAGNTLWYGRGDAATILLQAAKASQATAVYCNRRYDPWGKQRDHDIQSRLQQSGLSWRDFADRVLWEPGSILNKQDAPYKVYTPFAKTCLAQPALDKPYPRPRTLAGPGGLSLTTWSAVDHQHPWQDKVMAYWRVGEEGARYSWRRFIRQRADDYPEQRDIPGNAGTSELSPHLHFGEVGVRSLYWQLQEHLEQEPARAKDLEVFRRELLWREFAYHILHHFPHTTDAPMDERYEHFPWRDDQAFLRSWQAGQTGIPIVDAGMRQLWECGWMHNRVRMIVASFLVKHGLLHWRHGAQWFWDTLVDADLANNSLNWQWVSGCGADAAPYFRIFNPVLQGEKFDPQGDYVRTWVEELKDVDNKTIHQPWKDSSLAIDYPAPILDLKDGRERALAAFKRAIRQA